MLGRLKGWLQDRMPKPPLKEDAYPADARGRPDLSYYKDSAEYYYGMIQQYLGTLEGKQGEGYEPELGFRRSVHGAWGLIARGEESIPYAMRLLEHPLPEAKSAAAGVLAELREQPGVVEGLLRALDDVGDEGEVDEARDTIVGALGALRAKPAIPALARLIRDEHANPDSRWNAAEALGAIAGRRFEKEPQPVAAATDWLTSNGF